MPLHEIKSCPRCFQLFQCKAGSITQCDCVTIMLSEEETTFIASRYKDCLCLSCLKDLKNKSIFFGEKYFGV